MCDVVSLLVVCEKGAEDDANKVSVTSPVILDFVYALHNFIMLFRNVHRTVWRPSFLCQCQCNSTFPHPAQTSHATTEGDQRIRRRDFKHLSVEDKHKFRLSKIKAQQQKKVIRERAVFAALSDAEKREFKTRKILERERSQQRMKDAMESGYKVCVDLTLDENTHNDHDRSGLLNQLKHGYTFMKKSASPFHLHLTGVHTEINDLIVQRGFNNWHCTMQAESAWNWMADRRSDIVLLSPDAPEVLETIESDKVYVFLYLVNNNI